MASAGPYASLHLAPDRQPPVPHHSVFTGRMPFLPPSQQRQITEGKCQSTEGMKTKQLTNCILTSQPWHCWDLHCRWYTIWRGRFVSLEFYKRRRQDKLDLRAASAAALHGLSSVRHHMSNTWPGSEEQPTCSSNTTPSAHRNIYSHKLKYADKDGTEICEG